MRIVLFCVLFVLAAIAQAQTVYKWIDAQGGVHYGDRPPAEAAAKPVDIAPPPADLSRPVATATPAAAASGEPSTERAALDIVMYARDDCGYCRKARNYFSQRGIAYLERDVEHDARAAVDWKSLGGRGVPLFVINGEVSRGFSAEAMTQELRSYGW